MTDETTSLTIEERAEAFAQRAMENLKSGKIKKDTLPNSAVPFSIERAVKLVQDHKMLLESDLWEDFLSDVK